MSFLAFLQTPIVIAMLTIVLIIFVVILIKWLMQGGKYVKNTTANGKVVIITGANSGIGAETALDMAKRGARVYMACRDMAKCERVRQRIISETRNDEIYALKLDLASMNSIREFVKSTPSRIIVVSSLAHVWGKIKKDDLNSKKNYKPQKAYSQSKLANILFTRELAKRLTGTGVTVNALHPGVIATDITRNMGNTFLNCFYNFCFKFLLWPFTKTIKNGAQTTIHAAIEPSLTEVTGKYFSDCKLKEVAKHAQNDELAAWLWDISVEWTGLKNSI